jgi:AraC-like DNA-binding protein/mannose-6-phosphate isomerase-like protein (cupin superfamily)
MREDNSDFDQPHSLAVRRVKAMIHLRRPAHFTLRDLFLYGKFLRNGDPAAEVDLDDARIVRVETGFGTHAEVLRANYRTQSFARHTHDTYTLGLVRGGAGSFWCRGAERFVREGDIVVIPPAEIHTGSVSPRAGFLSYLAIYLPVDVAGLHGEAIADGKKRVLDARSFVFQDSSVRRAFQALDRATLSPRHANADAAAQTAVSKVVERLMSRGAPESVENSSAASEKTSRVVAIVRQVLEDSFASATETSLDALSARTGVTPFHVIRSFEAATGMSPHQYLIQVRVERARQLLARGTTPSAAAADSGFVDQSHLTFHFKKRFGITPGNYRRCVAVA